MNCAGNICNILICFSLLTIAYSCDYCIDFVYIYEIVLRFSQFFRDNSTDIKMYIYVLLDQQVSIFGCVFWKLCFCRLFSAVLAPRDIFVAVLVYQSISYLMFECSDLLNRIRLFLRNLDARIFFYIGSEDCYCHSLCACVLSLNWLNVCRYRVSDGETSTAVKSHHQIYLTQRMALPVLLWIYLKTPFRILWTSKFQQDSKLLVSRDPSLFSFLNSL